ncbi:hypothetical protein VULLAG_LOCUS8069 [Vulpes lagopus]
MRLHEDAHAERQEDGRAGLRLLLRYRGTQGTKLHFPESDAAAKDLPGRGSAGAYALLRGRGPFPGGRVPAEGIGAAPWAAPRQLLGALGV